MTEETGGPAADAETSNAGVELSTTDPDQAAAPQGDAATEDTQMEIHKPHAAKTWKEFFIELGTIVVGILIALGLEQAAEAAHDRTRAAQARENIRDEIAADLALMGTRDGDEGCVSRRLDEVDGLIRASAAGALPQNPIWIGKPFSGTMTDGQYRAAAQSGAVSLLPNQEQAGYATIYALFDQYYQVELNEAAAWADLRTLEKHPAGTPVLDWQLRSAMQKARTARFGLESSEFVARTSAAKLGVKPMMSLRFTQESACIPLNTERAEAEKRVLQGSLMGHKYDEP